MGGRWIDEWRAEGSRRGPDRDRERWDGTEGRSFQPDDRVFGERENGLGHNQSRAEGRGGGRPAWQDSDYEGVSPGFRQHEADYEREHPRFRTQDYTRGGGRFYGDDGGGWDFREDYGYGAAPRREEGRRFGSRQADERYERALRRAAPGRGYGYDRGYGDSGRSEPFEDRAREAGEFFRRTGRKVANWFSDIGEGAVTGRPVGARGLGPKGYKRSDERISDDVHQHLTDDIWLDASHIDVAVSDGEVTLSGAVVSRDAKHYAERLVEDLSGVTHVQNNLRVQLSTEFTDRYDAGIQEAHMRSEGDASMETSANASHTTTRRS